jgi:hypothetical protein
MSVVHFDEPLHDVLFDKDGLATMATRFVDTIWCKTATVKPEYL